ncbi:MAG: SBBP repeat-containing protein [Candidatus Thorarchaeota archaeon]
MRKRTVSFIVVLTLFICILVPQFPTVVEKRKTSSASDERESRTSEQVNDLANGVFLENRGQIDDPNTLIYAVTKSGLVGFGISKVSLYMAGSGRTVTLSFENANQVSPEGVEPTSFETNFFLGSRGSFTGIHGYKWLAYRNLFRGISLFYTCKPEGVKYEFRVAPGVDPEQISIQVSGHDTLTVESNAVRISQGDASFIDEGIEVYQGEVVVDSQFKYTGSDSFGFSISSYDTTQELVIDPLLYSTYLGGAGSDQLEAVAVDSEGNVYVAGHSYSSDFPLVNPYNDSHIGYDCVVLKMSSDGRTLLYSTFIGGSGDDYANGIAIDSAGAAYVTGYTTSTDFPTHDGYMESYAGGMYDCFVVKLSPSGSSLQYSTFFGGSALDRAYSIAVDSLNRAYVTGGTSSLNFPATTTAYNQSNSNEACFTAKFSSDGQRLLHSAVIGGNGGDRGKSIAADENGMVYVTGTTTSGMFFAVNAMDSTRGGNVDSFVLKLDAANDEIIFLTYFGGGGSEWGEAVAIDGEGNIYVAGKTESLGLATPGAYDTVLSTGGVDDEDCFVLKLLSDGSMGFCTYVGGTMPNHPYGMALDSMNSIYVVGQYASHSFPSVNPTDFGTSGDRVFAFKLSSDGSEMLYSTVGGSSTGTTETPRGVAIDEYGNAHVVGMTGADDFPSVNAYDDSFGGVHDGFVFKLGDLSDSDLDGLSDYTEYTVRSNRFSNDSDSDGLGDFLEYELGSNLTSSDSDNDLLDDYLEYHVYHTNLTNPDTDGDSFPDGWEVENGHDPNDPEDPPPDLGVPTMFLIAGLGAFGAVIIVIVIRMKEST